MVLLGALVGCSKEESPAAAPAADAALKITGKVDQELSWTEEEVRAMGTIEAESTNTAGETATYSGVPVNTLLDEAGVAATRPRWCWLATMGKQRRSTLPRSEHATTASPPSATRAALAR